MTRLLILLLFMQTNAISQELSFSDFSKHLIGGVNTSELFSTTVRIETVSKKQQVLSTGTGFFIAFKSITVNEMYPFIVSNNHVVKNGDSIRLHFREQNKLGDYINVTYSIPNTQKWVINHPDSSIDLVIIRFPEIFKDLKRSGYDITFKCLASHDIEKEFQEYQGISSFFSIGYPNGIYDINTHSPIVRKINNSSDMRLNYRNQKMFLINGPSLPGSSGSPLIYFEFNDVYFDKESQSTITSTRVKLLGILTLSHYSDEKARANFKKDFAATSREIEVLNATEMKLPSFAVDLGIALKANLLFDFIPSLKKFYPIAE